MDHAIQRRVVLAVISLVVISVGPLYWWAKEHNNNTYTVGLVYVPSRAFHEQVGGAIKDLVDQDRRFKLREFTAASASDQLLLSACCNTALDSYADILICIGKMSAQTLIKLSQKRNALKPILFLGVSDPVDLGLIDTVDRPGGNATGIYHDVVGQIVSPVDLLHLVKPGLKNILLPYAMNACTNESSALMLMEQWEQKNVLIKPMVIDTVSNALERISGML